MESQSHVGKAGDYVQQDVIVFVKYLKCFSPHSFKINFCPSQSGGSLWVIASSLSFSKFCKPTINIYFLKSKSPLN